MILFPFNLYFYIPFFLYRSKLLKNVTSRYRKQCSIVDAFDSLQCFNQPCNFENEVYDHPFEGHESDIAQLPKDEPTSKRPKRAFKPYWKQGKYPGLHFFIVSSLKKEKYTVICVIYVNIWLKC
jgi:hypothetical protein